MRLGSKAKLTIGIGILAAGSFAFLGVRELGRTDAATAKPAAGQEASAQTPSQMLLAATTRAIKTGETIRADMFRSAVSDPARFAHAATPAEVLGRVATRDIPANMLIARTAIGEETKLAIRVPMGMRAVSIDTTAEIAVSGLIRPGDRVDVQVVYPGADALSGARGMGRSQAATLLQKVQVLAVGDLVLGTKPDTGMTDEVAQAPAAPARTVTMALLPEQVSALSLAKSTGTLTLSLRNPEDGGDTQLAEVTAPRRFEPEPPVRQTARVVAPVRRTAARATAPRPKAEPTHHAIELVVGDRAKTIYSGSDTQ